MKNTFRILGIIALVAIIASSFVACGGGDDGGGGDSGSNTPNYDMTGTYTFTKNGESCTWCFYPYGNYSVNGYGFTETKYGKWLSIGNDVTIDYSSSNGSVSVTGKEVFTVQENGKQRTLSLKDNSAQLSNLLVSLGLGDRSVILTRISLWTAVKHNNFQTRIWAIAWGNDKFVAGGSYGGELSGHMAYSSDGITWTAVKNSPFSSSVRVSAIVWGNNKFIAVSPPYNIDLNFDFDREMAYSSDGITWTAITDNTITSIRNIAITYGNGKFVAGGSSGKVAYSTDGITWTAGTADDNTVRIWPQAYGDGKFVASTSGNNKIAYSSDGITWTVTTTVPPMDIGSIVYGNDKFVAAGGYPPKIVYLLDGINWTSTDSSISPQAYGNGKFVGSSNAITGYSSDGISWITIEDWAFTGFRAIAWGKDKFVAVGEDMIAYWSGD